MCSRGLAAHGDTLVCDGHQMMIDVDDGPLDKVAQGLVLKQLDDILGIGVDGVGAEGDSELLAERHSGLVCCVCEDVCLLLARPATFNFISVKSPQESPGHISPRVFQYAEDATRRP